MSFSVPLLREPTLPDPDIQLTKVSTIEPKCTNEPSLSPSAASDKSDVKWHSKPTNRIRFMVIFLLLTLLILAAVYRHKTLHYCMDFLEWMCEDPVQGSIAFIGLYIVFSVLMIPGSLLTLGAGFVFNEMLGRFQGLLVSSVVVWVGASMGATMAFINGRYLLRNLVKHFIAKSKKFELIDTVVGMNGFKVTFVLRLSPITPYNVFNYLMALTSVKLTDYVLACVGMIPDTIVFCFIGGSIASIAKLSSVGITSNPLLLAITIAGTILALCGVVYVSYLGKKEFDKLASQSKISIENESDVDNGSDVDCEYTLSDR